MISLFIDSSSNKEVVVVLNYKEKEYRVKKETDNRRAQTILPVVVNLLKDHKLSLRDVEAIEVNTGPGSFTGLRVGVTIANALGLVLGIPINGQKVGELVKPRYE